MSQIELSREDKEDLALIRAMKRASQGLPIEEEDVIASYLVNVKDDRERTRLKEHDVYSHSGWEFLADIFPRTFGFLISLARLENIYFISLDGLQRQEAILMTKAKSAAQTPLTIENIQGGPMNPVTPVQTPQQQQEQQQKKRGFWHRG